MKLHYLIITSLILLVSCSSPEDKYIGKYFFLISDKIELKTSSDYLSYNKYVPSAYHNSTKVYSDLSPVSFTLFKDGETGALKGEVRYEKLTVKQELFTPKIVTRNIDFDLENIRIEKDTLWFRMSNAELDSRGNKINGFIFKNSDSTIVGIDVAGFGYESMSIYNSHFIENNGKFVIHKLCPIGEKTDSVYSKYYYAQLVLLKVLDKSEVNIYKKQQYSNSITVLEEKLSKYTKDSLSISKKTVN